MQPLDVDVEIRPDGAGSYWVEVRSPAGEVRVSSSFPFDEIALENRLQALQIALLTSGRGQRADTSADGRSVEEFSSSLFEFLFAGEARSCYERSRDLAREQGAALRIRLRCHAPELASLPWEFLFDVGRSSYLSLSRRTQVVRYLEIPELIAPLRVAPPLRILGVVASPDDLPAIDVNRDRERLERSVAKLQRDGLVVLEWLPEPTWRSLQQALRHGQWHVFHFSGHGNFDRNKQVGQLAFVDDAAGGGTTRTSTRWLSADELGTLLGDTDSLRLAVLNACEGATADAQDVFSGTAASLVRRGTPAVVAMQYAISDRAAIELARSFYESLADGLSVDSALAEARKAMFVSISGTLEWGTPVLYMRTNSGVLFDVDRERAATPPETSDEVDEQPILELSATATDLVAHDDVGEIETPRLAVSRSEIDLGTVALDTPASQEVEVTNAGGGVLDVVVLHADTGLEANYRDGTLHIVFNPSVPGVFAGAIKLGGNGGDATVHVTAVIDPGPQLPTPIPEPTAAQPRESEPVPHTRHRARRVRPWLVIGVPIIILIAVGAVALRSGDVADTTNKTVEVSGTEQWTDTGLDLRPGDKVTVSAGGSVDVSSSPPIVTVGPDGSPEPFLRQFNLVEGNHAALIGRIGGGTPFVVGANSGFVVTEPGGVLDLGINDQTVSDNAGQFDADIEVRHP